MIDKILSIPIILLSLLTGQMSLQIQLIPKNPDQSTQEVSSKLEIITNDKLDSSIKLEYFDDFVGSWGSNSSSGTIWQGGYSAYSERTKPKPIKDNFGISYPNKLITIVSTNELKNNIFLGDEKLDYEMYKDMIISDWQKYNTNLVNYFWTKAERIFSITQADIDKDNIPETLIETMAAESNHPPHFGYIIKNDKIIVEVPISQGSIYAAKDGNGFYVEQRVYEGDACGGCVSIKRVFRIVYDQDKFLPVWQQDIKALIAN